MTAKPKSQQTQEKFIVRFPDGMRDQIAAAAEAAGRSMNAEIVLMLRDGLAAESPRAAWNAAVTSLSMAALSYQTIRNAISVVPAANRARLEQSADMAFINVAMMVRMIRSIAPRESDCEPIWQSVGKMIGSDEVFRVPLIGLPPADGEEFDPDLMPIPPHRST